jgi:ribosome biogenesis protein Tsr3
MSRHLKRVKARRLFKLVSGQTHKQLLLDPRSPIAFSQNQDKVTKKQKMVAVEAKQQKGKRMREQLRELHEKFPLPAGSPLARKTVSSTE